MRGDVRRHRLLPPTPPSPAPTSDRTYPQSTIPFPVWSLCFGPDVFDEGPEWVCEPGLERHW